MDCAAPEGKFAEIHIKSYYLGRKIPPLEFRLRVLEPLPVLLLRGT